MDIITAVQAELLRAATTMVAKKEVDHLLYIGDLPLPQDLVRAKSTARRKLVQAVSSDAQLQVIEALGIETLSMPTYDIARPERFKIALVSGIAKGLFSDGEVVVGLIGRTPASYPDTLMAVMIGGDDERGVDTGFGMVGTDRIPSTILESVIDLAVGIARDGWEGHPLGALLVVGDTASVMEKSRQLTLNPFQGYSESEKNIINPDVRAAIKNFAVLDGAFVIREDGVVLAAGRYLKVDTEGDSELEVPLGLGSRHMAACAISQATDAIALVVSETTGVTRVFQGGKCLLEIHPDQAQRTRRPGDEVEKEAEAEVKEAEKEAEKEKGKEPKKEAKAAGGKSKESKEKASAKESKEKASAKESKSKKG